MWWGPWLYLRKHFGGVTGVYLSVGRGDDQPVMINPGLSQRMRPPLHEGLGYSVSPLCPSTCSPAAPGAGGSARGSQADAAPAPAPGCPATLPSCAPTPGWVRPRHKDPAGGAPPSQGSARVPTWGPDAAGAPSARWHPRAKWGRTTPLPGAGGGVGPLHLLQVLYKALAAVELPVPDPWIEACATS